MKRSKNLPSQVEGENSVIIINLGDKYVYLISICFLLVSQFKVLDGVLKASWESRENKSALSSIHTRPTPVFGRKTMQAGRG